MLDVVSPEMLFNSWQSEASPLPFFRAGVPDGDSHREFAGDHSLNLKNKPFYAKIVRSRNQEDTDFFRQAEFPQINILGSGEEMVPILSARKER